MKTELIRAEWVKSAYNDPGKPAWSVTVKQTAETMEEVEAMGGVASKEQLMDLAALKDQMSLADVVDTINAEAAVDLAAARADMQAKDSELEAAKETISSLQSALAETSKAPADPTA